MFSLIMQKNQFFTLNFYGYFFARVYELLFAKAAAA